MLEKTNRPSTSAILFEAINNGERSRKRLADIVYDVKPDSSPRYRDSSRTKLNVLIGKARKKGIEMNFVKGVLIMSEDEVLGKRYEKD